MTLPIIRGTKTCRHCLREIHLDATICDNCKRSQRRLGDFCSHHLQGTTAVIATVISAGILLVQYRNLNLTSQRAAEARDAALQAGVALSNATVALAEAQVVARRIGEVDRSFRSTAATLLDEKRTFFFHVYVVNGSRLWLRPFFEPLFNRVHTGRPYGDGYPRFQHHTTDALASKAYTDYVVGKNVQRSTLFLDALEWALIDALKSIKKRLGEGDAGSKEWSPEEMDAALRGNSLNDALGMEYTRFALGWSGDEVVAGPLRLPFGLSVDLPAVSRSSSSRTLVMSNGRYDIRIEVTTAATNRINDLTAKAWFPVSSDGQLADLNMTYLDELTYCFVVSVTANPDRVHEVSFAEKRWIGGLLNELENSFSWQILRKRTFESPPEKHDL